MPFISSFSQFSVHWIGYYRLVDSLTARPRVPYFHNYETASNSIILKLRVAAIASAACVDIDLVTRLQILT
jgi:hypothetical protein